MGTLVQLIMNSVIAGSSYAMVSLGYAMVFSILRLMNWAHGYVVMLGAFFAYTFAVTLNLNIFVSIILAGICCATISVLIEFVGYRRLRKARRIAATVSGMGIAFLIQASILLTWGAQMRTFPKTVTVGYNVLGGYITGFQITVLAISLGLLFVTRYLVYKSPLGLKIRATADDLEMVSMLGINSNLVISSVFAVGGFLAAVAGSLVAWDTSASSTIGLAVTMKSFAAVIIGGFGSIEGAIIGGMVIGIAENFGIWFIPSMWKDSISFVILIIMLMFRPSGIAGVVSETEI